MKKLLKTISTLLIAVLLVTTSFASSVKAESATDTAVVTINNLEEGDQVKLYKIVKAVYDGEDFKGYEFVDGLKLIGPDTKVEITFVDDSVTPNVTYKAYLPASSLDSNDDGKVDEEIELASVVGLDENGNTKEFSGKTWTVDTSKKGYVVYDMSEPTQSQINLAVKELATLIDGTATYTTPVVAEGQDYVQQSVNPGQYLGIIVPSGEYTYNPVVVSAGYQNLQIYKKADTDATHSKKVNGSYVGGPIPNATNYYEYDNCALNDQGEVVFAETNNDTGAVAGQPYKHLYIADGGETNTANILIAEDLDVDLGYKYPEAQGTQAFPKKQKPGIDKEHETDHPEESTADNPIKVAVVALDEKGNVKVDASDNLVYIKAPYTAAQHKLAVDGVKFYLDTNDNLYKQIPDGGTQTAASQDTVITAMETPIVKEATTMSPSKNDQAGSGDIGNNKDGVFTVGQGEEIRYTLTPTIPQYPANARNKTFVITDNLSNGLDFVEGSIYMNFTDYDYERKQVADNKYEFYVYEPSGKFNLTYGKVNGGEGTYYKDGERYAEINHPAQPLQDQTQAYTRKKFAVAAEAVDGKIEGKANDNDFQINFIYDNLPGEEGSKVSPVITYKACLTENAIQGVEGNPNVVKVYFAKNTGDDKDWDVNKWEEPNGDDYNEWRDFKKVYTYEVRFRKTNEKPEYLEILPSAQGEVPTHYMLKNPADVKNEINASSLSAEEKNELITKVDDVYASLKRQQAEVKLVNDVEEVRYVVETAPTPLKASDNVTEFSFVPGNGNKNVKANPEFKVSDLAGAVFGLYKGDAANPKDTDELIETIIINANGIGHSTKIHSGEDDYYVKELVPPAGYAKNTEAYDVTPSWTSATTYSTDGVERFIYTVKINEAIDIDEDNTKPAVKSSTNAGANAPENTISDTAANAKAEDQVGWLVGSGNNKLYEFGVYDITDVKSGWTYHEDATAAGAAVPYEAHTMVHTDGTVIKNVYRAYVKEHVKTTSVNENTYYQNNGGTVEILRIKNTKISTLPSTGGIGTYMFTIAGVAILATAAFMLIFRKKESSK